MKHTTIFIYLFLILTIYIEQQQSFPLKLPINQHVRNYLLSWKRLMNNIEHRQNRRLIDRHFKRLTNDLLVFLQPRRFGNTKYG